MKLEIFGITSGYTPAYNKHVSCKMHAFESIKKEMEKKNQLTKRVHIDKYFIRHASRQQCEWYTNAVRKRRG